MATSSRRRTQQSDRTRLFLVLGGVGVVALAIAIAVLTTGEADVPSTADISADVDVSGDPLPTHVADDADPVVGTPAPTVTGVDFSGQPQAIAPAQGRTQLLAFMASWCPACQQELPHIVEWMADGGVPDNVDLVLVSTLHNDTRPNWPPQPWLEQAGYAGAVLVDDVESTVAIAYGLSGTPFWVAIDEQGDVVFRHSGMLQRNELDEIGAFLAAS